MVLSGTSANLYAHNSRAACRAKAQHKVVMNVQNCGKVHIVGNNFDTQNRIRGEFKSKLK